MIDKRKTALIVGATGVVGRNLLRHLVANPEWNVIAVSRRKPDVPGDYRHIAVDLLDRNAAVAAFARLTDVTHLFFSAYIEKPSWYEMVAPNLALLTHVVDAIEPVATRLQHINLLHGTKWYGNHLGPFKTPARETDPGHMPPNFYYDQQAFIVERQKGKSWSWSSARPHSICGFATGNPMNLVTLIAVYATISKALGLPLRHPGSEANAHALFNVTDSDLLARSCVWMATDPAAANEPFNITNGDMFRWTDMWETIAEFFGMKTAQPQKIDLTHMMSDKSALWDRLTAEHSLNPIKFEDIVQWKYGNSVFSSEFDIISSTIKSRKYGFMEFIDSSDMFINHFIELRGQKIIP